MTLEERLLEQELSDLENILNKEYGRRFIWRILSTCGVYQDIHSDSTEETARKLGQRSIGLWLMQVVGDCNQDQLFNMMREAKIRAAEIELMAEHGIDKKDKEQVESVEDFI